MRPTSLLRSDSDRPQFTTPVVAIKKESIDCGISSLIPCCLPTWCHRFATPKVFLSSLAKLALVQGALQAYFAITLSTISQFYEYPHHIVEWLSISHDIFMAVFAVLVAHHGYRIHRPVWIGALTCIQGIASILVIIPYNYYVDKHGETATGNLTGANLCNAAVPLKNSLELLPEEDDNGWITLGILITLQLITGLANTSFYAHGFSYLDDNTEKHVIPVYLCILMAVRMMSFQIGSLIAWFYLKPGMLWGAGYYAIGALLIKCGILVIMFPKQLLTIIMKNTVANIVETARGGSNETLEETQESPKHLGFFSSLRRVCTNKIIIINTLSSVFMYMALDNFSYYEGKYMESQYYLPTVGEGFSDPWTSRLVKNIVRTPTVALIIIISGLVVSKFQPKARKLAIWSVIVSIVVGCIFIGTLFIKCEKPQMVGEYKTHLINPYCSKGCNCDLATTKFEPVCTQGGIQTYYSPCHAGCSSYYFINNLKVYSNCSCSITSLEGLATPGACNSDNCANSWMIFQALSVVSNALIATGFIGNLLITIRSVIPSDKSMAIAFELALAGLLVHVPGKQIYGSIAGSNCQYIDNDGTTCNLHNDSFGMYISVASIILLFVSAAMDIILVFFVKDLELYDEDEDNNNILMRPINRIEIPTSDDPNEPVAERASLVVTRASIEPRSLMRSSRGPPSRTTSTSSGRPESDPPRYSDIERRRPPRPRQSVNRDVSSEDEPLSDRTETASPVRVSMTPRSQDGVPMGNETAQRNLIEEFRQKQGTIV